jgi:hypothetical protein
LNGFDSHIGFLCCVIRGGGRRRGRRGRRRSRRRSRRIGGSGRSATFCCEKFSLFGFLLLLFLLFYIGFGIELRGRFGRRRRRSNSKRRSFKRREGRRRSIRRRNGKSRRVGRRLVDKDGVRSSRFSATERKK